MRVPVRPGVDKLVRRRVGNMIGVFAVRLSGGQLDAGSTTDTFGMVTLIWRPHFLAGY